MATYRILRGTQYPASREVRERIRGGERIPLSERGEWAELAAGEVAELPDDIVAALLEAGAVEIVTAPRSRRRTTEEPEEEAGEVVSDDA